MKITVAAPAKVNLWLQVGPRRADGYHSIDTLFCSLELADSVTVRPGSRPAPQLEVDHGRPLAEPPDLGPPEDNLAVRAAAAFMARAGLEHGPRIRVVKRIPAGAGLGGGSSDGAAVLRAMHRLYPGRLSAEDLLELGADLGSDVPFFVHAVPLAHGTGRGERLAPLTPLEARPVVVVLPGLPVSTADAYRWLDEDRVHEPSFEARRPSPDALDWAAVAARATNDFESAVLPRHPRLADLRDRLRHRGADPALLAGSGSTVFGVFGTRHAARQAARALKESDPAVRALVTRTRSR